MWWLQCQFFLLPSPVLFLAQCASLPPCALLRSACTASVWVAYGPANMLHRPGGAPSPCPCLEARGRRPGAWPCATRPAHGRRAASPRAGRRATPRGAATLLSPAAVGASRGPPLSHRPPPPWIGLRHPPTNQHRTPVLTSVHLAWLRQRRRARPPRLFEQQERLVPQSDCAELLFGPCAPRRRCWCPRYCFDRKTYHHSA